MIITNNFKLPDVVVSALTQDDYTKGKSNRSVTQLIDSPQVAVLGRGLEPQYIVCLKRLLRAQTRLLVSNGCSQKFWAGLYPGLLICKS